jgi:hypothetical protein
MIKIAFYCLFVVVLFLELVKCGSLTIGHRRHLSSNDAETRISDEYDGGGGAGRGGGENEYDENYEDGGTNERSTMEPVKAYSKIEGLLLNQKPLGKYFMMISRSIIIKRIFLPTFFSGNPL